MDFNIKAVETKAEKLKFIKSQWNFYERDNCFVPPVIHDRLKLLDTEKNPFYMHSEIKLFMAERNGNVIGRIAAITNQNHNDIHKDNIGFFGFFECVEEQPVADALFNEAVKWLKSKGKSAIRGPVNPSTNDEVGLLVEGQNSPPVILMTYNPIYYQNLILGAGLNQVKELYAYYLERQKYLSPKVERLQDLIRKKYNVTTNHVSLKNEKKFRQDFDKIKQIYNTAWQPNWGFVKMTDEEFEFLAKDFRQFADEELAIMAYVNGEPAGFALALPDINQCLIHNKKGSLAGAVWHLLTKKKKIDTLRILILGVLPEFQRTGIDSILYYELGKAGLSKGIIKGEASWILEDNTMMNRGLTQTMNGWLYKRYRIYEKEI